MPSTHSRDRVLNWVLPLLPAAIAFLLLCLVVVAVERIVADEIKRRASFRVELTAQIYADQLSRTLAHRAAELVLMGEMSRSGIGADNWRVQMQRLKNSSPSYVWIGATDAQGAVEVASDTLLEGASIATRNVFVNGRDGLWFGSLHPPVVLQELLRVNGLPVPAALADIAMPIYDAAGQPRGIIASHLDAQSFEEERQLALGPLAARWQLRLALVDAEGRVLIGDHPAISEQAWHELLAAPAEQSREVLDERGAPYLLSRHTVRPLDSQLQTAWQVVSSQPLSTALAPVYELKRRVLAWGGGATLLLGLAGFALSRHLSRPYSETERHLREQGEVLSAVIGSASDAVISVGVDGRISLFNPAAARIFGHRAEQMIGQPLDVLLPRSHLALYQLYLRGLAKPQATSGPIGMGLVTGLRADGQELDLEVSISQITVSGNRQLTAILRDVSERVRAERALTQSRLELSELTQRLLQQEKQTARKLAQTLHDQLGQTLGAIRLSFDALCAMLPTDLAAKTLERERTLAQLIETANHEVRQALVSLRPPFLDENGLQAALAYELQARAADAEPVALRLDVAPSSIELRWPADVEYAAFMVAREALANAVLHARADEVVVHVDGAPAWLHLRVSDDGAGLSDELAAGRPGHLGIVGMRERANAIGARMEVKGLPGGGTVISLTWEAQTVQGSADQGRQGGGLGYPA